MKVEIFLYILALSQIASKNENEYFNCKISSSYVFAPIIESDSIKGSQMNIKHVLILPRKFCQELVVSARNRIKIKEGNGCVSDNGNGIEIEVLKRNKDEYKYIETLEMDCQNDSEAYSESKKGIFKIKFNKDVSDEISRIDTFIETENKKIGYLLRPDVLPILEKEYEKKIIENWDIGIIEHK